MRPASLEAWRDIEAAFSKLARVFYDDNLRRFAITGSVGL